MTKCDICGKEFIMGGFLISGADGNWTNLGYVSDDGITLSSGNKGIEIGPDHLSLMDGNTETVRFGGADVIAGWPAPQDVTSSRHALRMSFRHVARRDMLRERAEAIGGKFLRSYLRSQRRSRANTTGRKYATGGVRHTEVVVYGVRIEPLLTDSTAFAFTTDECRVERQLGSDLLSAEETHVEGE